MQNLVRLKTEHRHNAVYHGCDVTEDDYRRLEPSIQLLERLADIEKSTLTVFDMNRRKYLLSSTKFKEMLGYTSSEDLVNDDMEKFHAIIHPIDLPIVLDTENRAYEFFNNLSAEEKKNYKLVYDFRVRNASGIYMRFIHQLAVLEQDHKGKSWLILIITEMISECYQETVMQRRMINMKTGRLHLFNSEIKSSSGQLLTRRETEVLRLISQGLDSQQISDKLCISVNTVNNHRQAILSRTSTTNMTQAIFYAKKLGII